MINHKNDIDQLLEAIKTYNTTINGSNTTKPVRNTSTK